MAIRVQTAPRTAETITNPLTNVWSDIELDLNFNAVLSKERFGTPQKTDLAQLTEYEAVIRSIVNILTTPKGTKILNPEFGLDLRYWVFESIDNDTAFFLGKELLDLERVEPRLQINSINIRPEPDDNSFFINMDIVIPNTSPNIIQLKGRLNQDGITIIS